VVAWKERLRPRSTEGDVYRDEWLERSELIFDGGCVLIASLAAVSFVANDEWLWDTVMLIAPVVMIMVARLVFFRPHLVVGGDVLVLAGVFHTRRIPVGEVRRAVAAKGALKLELTDADEVYVPGHFLLTHAHGARYAYLAQTINARVATPTIAADAEDDS
jgi:hypothetical protein